MSLKKLHFLSFLYFERLHTFLVSYSKAEYFSQNFRQVVNISYKYLEFIRVELKRPKFTVFTPHI